MAIQIDTKIDVPGRLLMLCVSGSHAYGTATEQSDVDVRGIFIPDSKYLLGFSKRVEQIEWKPDTVVYALAKYLALAVNANPNILELMFVPEDCLLHTDPLFRWLLDVRQSMLSRQACKSFVGYAYAQLHRIRTHRNWLLHPPKAAPTRDHFGLPEVSLLSRDQRGAFYILVARLLRDHPEMERLLDAVQEIIEAEKFPGWEGIVQRRGIPVDALGQVQELTRVSDNFIAVLQREQAYHRAVDEWSKYQDWLRSRNPDRAALEARFGLDTKHLSHLVRLMLSGEELMRHGTLTVRRPEAESLLAIRRDGIWLDGTPITSDSFDGIVAWTKQKEEELFALYHGNCPLPKKPDVEAVDVVCRMLSAYMIRHPQSEEDRT